MPFDAPDAPTRLADLIGWIADRFAATGLYFGHGTDNPLDEAAWLATAVLGIASEQLDEHLDDTLDAATRARLLAIAEQRQRTRKPLAYLLNEAWFAGERFYVDERVLIPRSFIGEFLREQLQPWIEPNRVKRVLDVGTGSGCLAILAALSFPQVQVDASDISHEALAVAAINVERFHLTSRVRLQTADVYAGLGASRYDVILSNPPYVDPAEFGALPDEYHHEPRLALAADDAGLAIVRRLLAGAAERLEPKGVLIIETGNSAELLQARLPHVPFTWLTSRGGDESVLLLTVEQLSRYHATLNLTEAR